MLLSLEKTNPSPQKDTKTKKHTHTHTQKQQQNKQKQQQHIKAPVYITGGDATRQLLCMINR